MRSIPWVGWYDQSGRPRLSTWIGEARYVIVTGVDVLWCPVNGLSDDAEVLEVPDPAPGTSGKDAHAANLALARRLEGHLVVVLNTLPRGRVAETL